MTPLIIEVKNGVISNIISNREISIVTIDHDFKKNCQGWVNCVMSAADMTEYIEQSGTVPSSDQITGKP